MKKKMNAVEIIEKKCNIGSLKEKNVPFSIMFLELKCFIAILRSKWLTKLV